KRLFVPSVTGALLAMLVLAPAASAAPVVVNCDAGANLQTAIDGSPTGSTLLVRGTCVGSFLIADKNLALMGIGNATLDGDHVGRVLYISGWTSGADVRVANVTITNGIAEDGNGGGGVLTQASRVVMTNVSVTANTSNLGGGGIENDLSDLTLMASSVTANHVTTAGFGGGVASNSSVLTIVNSLVSANSTAGTGGGLGIQGGS